LRLPPDLTQTYILTEIAETKEAFTFRQWKKEEVPDLAKARTALKQYEDLAIMV
jgi:hypothetical protein